MFPLALGVLTLAAFPTPPSPAIPASITVAADSVCTRDYTAIPPYGKTWAADGGTVTVGAETVFKTAPGKQRHFYLKFNSALDHLMRDMTYTIKFDMKLSQGGATSNPNPSLKFPPGVMIHSEEGRKYAIKDFESKSNLTADKPTAIVDERQLVMSETDLGSGWFTYQMQWVPSKTVYKPTQMIWIDMFLSSKPDTGVEWAFRDFCVTRESEVRNPPPAVPSFNEKFVIKNPSSPSASELTVQSNCPWDEAGLVTWESIFGTMYTGTLTVPANTKVVVGPMSFVSSPYEKIVVPDTSELIFKDDSISLLVRALVVNGKLRIGSPTCRVEGLVRITFWGGKTDPDYLNGFGTKGLAVVGPSAEVDMFGRRYFPTWSRLARTGRAGDDRVYLQEAVNWYPGQEVVLTTTTWDDTGLSLEPQNEVMVIQAVGGGKIVQFTESMRFYHYAGKEYQGEVALLTRNIMLEGEPDADGFGGHFIVAGKRGRIAGVASRYMGQTNVMARYPFHVHLLGQSSDSLFSDCVARDTYFRCFVIHGTHGMLETENVAFNATGNCYYVEDGIEENNTVSYNLAAYVKPIGAPAAGAQRVGETIIEDLNPGGLTSGQRAQPADASAAGFYFSNAYNTIIGNSASGGWSGFGFPGLPNTIGAYKADKTLAPNSRPLKEFNGNTAHSTGWYWSVGGTCFYAGGELSYQSDGRLKYVSGNMARNTRVEISPTYRHWEGTPLFMEYKNLLGYGCNKGFLQWGKRTDVSQFEFHDVARSYAVFGDAALTNGLINGLSDNIDSGFGEMHHDGFQFYDKSVATIVSDVEFRNYQPEKCRDIHTADEINYVESDTLCSRDVAAGAKLFHHQNVVWSALFESDQEKPEQISATNKIRYTNVDKDRLISTKISESGGSRYFNFVDFDGSAVEEMRPTIVGSHMSWWHVCDDCRFESRWQTWLCPKVPGGGFAEREVAHILVETPDILPANGGIGHRRSCDTTGYYDYSKCTIGYSALWGHGPLYGDTLRSSPLTQNAGVTGITGTGWYFWFNGGSPAYIKIQPRQIPKTAKLRVAFSFPSGTTFTINGDDDDYKSIMVPFTAAADMADLEANPEDKYYFDGATLFLIPKLYPTLETPRFEKGGAWIYQRYDYYNIKIRASCATSSNGFCSAMPTEAVPAWMGGCPNDPTPSPPTAVPDTIAPTAIPTTVPTAVPTDVPTAVPTTVPTAIPTTVPTAIPTALPTIAPTAIPTTVPTTVPTDAPTAVPTTVPTAIPTTVPTAIPTALPTVTPTAMPTAVPTVFPTAPPTVTPTAVPTAAPTTTPPTAASTVAPGSTAMPTSAPTGTPTETPTAVPTLSPTVVPTDIPTAAPTAAPGSPTAAPTSVPTVAPGTVVLTSPPTTVPTAAPRSTSVPTTAVPTTTEPTTSPTGTTAVPTTVTPNSTTLAPAGSPTRTPVSTSAPGLKTTASPTLPPTLVPDSQLTAVPTQTPATLPPGSTAVPTQAPALTTAPSATGTPIQSSPAPRTTRPTTMAPTKSTSTPTQSPGGIGCKNCSGWVECAQRKCVASRCILQEVRHNEACGESGVCKSGVCTGAALVPEAGSDDSSSNSWIWIVIGVAALLLCGLAAGTLAWRKRREELSLGEMLGVLEMQEPDAETARL